MVSIPRWTAAPMAAVWVVLLFFLGTGRPRKIPNLGQDASERVQHLVAFSVFAALVMLTGRGKPIVVFVTLVAIGLAGEVVQLWIPDREFDLLDLAMDAIGASAGIAATARFSGARTRAVVMPIAAVLLVLGPFVPYSDKGLELVFPDDCAEPPAAVERAPAVVLEQTDFGDLELPRVIDEPSVADVRAAILATNEITVEAWFETSDLGQSGPVRIFTISGGTAEDEVNTHIGLEGDDLSVRLRTSCNIFQWEIATGVIDADEPQHAVFTWRQGHLRAWVNGVQVFDVDGPWGDFARWDPDFDIVVGGEASGARRFAGVVYSVTIWDAALSDEAIVERSTAVPVAD